MLTSIAKLVLKPVVTTIAVLVLMERMRRELDPANWDAWDWAERPPA